MILLSDPRIGQIPVADCGEPLTEIRLAPALSLDLREQDPGGAFGRVRAGVLGRLESAARSLPEGTRLLIIEGHRTTAEQARRYARYEARLRRAGVTDPAGLRRRVAAFVSPVDVAPHCAGAAVDLTLIDASGNELDMGGPVNGHRTGGERLCPMNAPGLPAHARANRDLLAAVMTAAGFVNYPAEWWHWSHGDRYWAFVTGAGTAIYGPA